MDAKKSTRWFPHQIEVGHKKSGGLEGNEKYKQGFVLFSWCWGEKMGQQSG